MAHNHLIADKSLLINVRPAPPNSGGTITADGSLHHPSHIGTLPVVLRNLEGTDIGIYVQDVLVMPSWPSHHILFSIGQWEQLLDESGHPIFQKQSDCLLFRDGSRTHHFPYSRTRLHTIHAIAIGPKALDAFSRPSTVAAATPPRPFRISSSLAHHRLGFIHPAYISATINQSRGLELIDSPSSLQTPVSEAALHGMSHRQPLVRSPADPSQTIRRNWLDKSIATLHFDVHGPFIDAINHALYYSSYHTETRMAHVFFHRSVDETTLLNGLKSACLELGTPREIRMDRNQTLLKNDPTVVTSFQQSCLTLGIALKISPPYHQEMDGVSEKSGGRDVYEHATALLYAAAISMRFWPFAVQAYVEISNYIPRPSTNNQSPYFQHYGLIPYIGHLRHFGCPAFVHQDKAARGTTAAFSSRVERCIHLGTARDSSPGTYLLYKLSTKQIILSRDVYFDETFRFVTRTPNGWIYNASRLQARYDTLMGAPPGIELVEHDDILNREANRPPAQIEHDADSSNQVPSSRDAPIIPPLPSPQATNAPSPTSSEPSPSSPVVDDDIPALIADDDSDDSDNDDQPAPRRTSSRSRRSPRRFEPDSSIPDFLWTDSSACSTTPSSSKPPAMKSYLQPDWSRCDRDFQTFAKTHGLEPAQASYRKELNGVIDAGVLSEPMLLPPGQKPLSTRIIVKEKTDGTLKSRFCVRGCHQTHGVNYDHDAIYAPVADRISVRTVFAVAAVLCAHIHTLDINLAFLYGDMPDDYQVYVKPPAGCTFGPDKVCRLLKSLYGLKQAPSIFRNVLHEFIVSLGFAPCHNDPCVYFRFTDSVKTLLAIHVDDILCICTDLPTLDTFKSAVKNRFQVKDQGPINGKTFLGLEVDHDQAQGVINLHCDSFIRRSLATLDIDPSTIYPASTPLSKAGVTGSPPAAQVPLSQNQLRQLSGILTYATVTCRPDLAVAASKLSSTTWTDIKVDDLTAGKRAIQYLAGTLKNQPKFGLRYNKAVFDTLDQASTLLCYADSDYAGDEATCKSRSGHAIMLCNALIYWSSRLQDTIALSSTAAELTSLSDLCRRLIWITELLNQLGCPQRLVPIYEDNKPAIAIAYRANLSTRVRHMRIRDLHVRELCHTDLCRVYYCSTTANISDFMTKVLTGRPFKTATIAFSGYTNLRHLPPQVFSPSDYNIATSDLSRIDT